MGKLRELFAPLQTWFERLSDRERKLVALAGSAVLVFVLRWSVLRVLGACALLGLGLQLLV